MDLKNIAKVGLVGLALAGIEGCTQSDYARAYSRNPIACEFLPTHCAATLANEANERVYGNNYKNDSGNYVVKTPRGQLFELGKGIIVTYEDRPYTVWSVNPSNPPSVEIAPYYHGRPIASRREESFNIEISTLDVMKQK